MLQIPSFIAFNSISLLGLSKSFQNCMSFPYSTKTLRLEKVLRNGLLPDWGPGEGAHGAWSPSPKPWLFYWPWKFWQNSSCEELFKFFHKDTTNWWSISNRFIECANLQSFGSWLVNNKMEFADLRIQWISGSTQKIISIFMTRIFSTLTFMQ